MILHGGPVYTLDMSSTNLSVVPTNREIFEPFARYVMRGQLTYRSRAQVLSSYWYRYGALPVRINSRCLIGCSRSSPMKRENESKPVNHNLALETQLRGFFADWYQAYGRSFPWRASDTTPFGILVAELLLRQTRAEMVADAWPRLVHRCPTPSDCLTADESELLRLLIPLGLGSQRLVALRAASMRLVEDYDGEVPSDVETLADLPHLGLYSAHAIACFAFDQRVPVVDGNILRILTRLTGVDFGRDNRRGRAPEAWKLAWRILPTERFKEHNYGMLDFSAQICTSRSPKHAACPLTPVCQAWLQDLPVQPVRNPTATNSLRKD